MGSGTISGPDKGSYGSMLEIAWNGTEPIKLLDGEQRSFVQDYDTIILRAKATNSEIRIDRKEHTV